MAESNHCASKLLPRGVHVGSGGTCTESDEDEDGDELDPPIISLSKSSIDMVTASPQRMELAWLRPNLRKTVSTQRPHSLAGSDISALKLSGMPPGGSPLLRQERSSLCSGGSSADTVIWRGGSRCAWSVSDDSCAKAALAPERPSRMGLAGDGLPPCTSYSYRDPQGGQVEGRDGPCLCSYSRSGHGVSRVAGASTASRFATLETQSHEDARRSSGNFETVWGAKGQATHSLDFPLLEGGGCSTECTGGVLQGTSAVAYANANANSTRRDGQLQSAVTYGAEAQRSAFLGGSLAFPPLASSISETGLDRCALSPCSAPQSSDPSSPMAAASAASGAHRRMWPLRYGMVREAGTMTSRGELRDVGVQTAALGSPTTLTALLAGQFLPVATSSSSEAGEGSAAREPDGVVGVGGWSPHVREVEWDEEGMTWEVYGASVDPEELGQAIQKHLELQIGESVATATDDLGGKGQDGAEPEGAEEEKPSGEGTQQNGKKRRVGLRMSLRRPGCCLRPSTAGD